MASRRTQRSLATVLSVLGHAALVALLTYGIPLASPDRTGVSAGNPIETVMVSDTAVLEELARLEAADQEVIRQREQAAEEARQKAEEERQKLAQIEADRIAAEQRAELERQQREKEQREADAAAEAEKIRIQQAADAEVARLAKIEADRIEAERKADEERKRREEVAAELAALEAEKAAEQERLRQVAEERAKREAEEAARIAAELERQKQEIAAQVAAGVVAEEADRQAREAGLRDQWARQIGQKVESKWQRPLNAGSDLECLLIVNQLPDGTVTGVTVSECNTTDENIIRSLENGVMSASPLPRRPEGVAFESVVRIRFKPTD